MDEAVARLCRAGEAVDVEVVLVKARSPDEHDRVFIERAGRMEQAAVHVIHDLPHLVVESLFELDGLWSELAAGAHADASRATTARDPKRRKQGHIVGAGARADCAEGWLTDRHRFAKVATNAVVNRWEEGPSTAEGVRARLLAASDAASAAELLERVDDATIDLAIAGVDQLLRRWIETPPGGTLRLSWPLPRSFFGDASP